MTLRTYVHIYLTWCCILRYTRIWHDAVQSGTHAPDIVPYTSTSVLQVRFHRNCRKQQISPRHLYIFTKLHGAYHRRQYYSTLLRGLQILRFSFACSRMISSLYEYKCSQLYNSHILAIPWTCWPISNRADPWPLQNIILKFRVIINSITLGTHTRYSAYINIHCNYSALIYPHSNVTLMKQLLNFNWVTKYCFTGGQTHSKFIPQDFGYQLNAKFN